MRCFQGSMAADVSHSRSMYTYLVAVWQAFTLRHVAVSLALAVAMLNGMNAVSKHCYLSLHVWTAM